MAHTIRGLFFAVAALSAQDCQLPPEISSLTLSQVRAQIAGGRDDFFLYQRWIDVTPARPKPGVLSAEFQKRLEQHPDDARFLYLYGRALIGRDTPQAILYLNRASQADPKLAWVYTALASIYASRNFADEDKLLANVRAYRSLCPSSVDAFRYLSKVKATDWPGQLRPLLEARREPGDADLWRMLWTSEFRLAPKEDYPALRQRIAADVKRLESLAPPHDYKFQLALFDGYNLSGQTDSAQKIDQVVNNDQFRQAHDAWVVQNGALANSITLEEHKAMMRDLAKRSAEWVVQWPSSVNAWEERLSALSYAPDRTKQEMERVGDEVLKLDAQQSMGWTDIPRKLRVAEIWTRNGVRLKDAVKLAEDALEEISQGPEVMSDLTVPPNARSQTYGFDSSTWDAMAAVVNGAAQLKDFDKAGSMLHRMQQWLDDNPAKKDGFQGRYFRAAGEIAEARGNKLDAAGFYAKSMSVSYRDSDLMKHALALWEEAGGTKDVLEALAARPPAPKPAKVATALEFSAWRPSSQRLPEMNLQDLLGKSWTLTSLKGKRTFVNVWATYCTPCTEELPDVQKLYELSLKQDGIQVITLNVDKNPGELEPFLKSLKYTFPVITDAQNYVQGITGPFSIPMNWMVDRSGVIDQQSNGFEPRTADWAAQMLEKLASSK